MDLKEVSVKRNTFFNYYLVIGKYLIQSYPGDGVASVSGHHQKVHSFLFPSACKSYIYTIMQSRVCNSIMSEKQYTYLNLKIVYC